MSAPRAATQPGEWLPVTNQAGRLVGWGRYWLGVGVEYRWGKDKPRMTNADRTRPPEEIAAFGAWLEARADDAEPWRSDMLSEDWGE